MQNHTYKTPLNVAYMIVRFGYTQISLIFIFVFYQISKCIYTSHQVVFDVKLHTYRHVYEMH